MSEGGKEAIRADDEVVAKAEVLALQKQVRELQRVLGEEARAQCAALLAEGHPHTAVACIGGGSNAAGTFAGFEHSPTRLVGVEAAGGTVSGTQSDASSECRCSLRKANCPAIRFSSQRARPSMIAPSIMLTM